MGRAKRHVPFGIFLKFAVWYLANSHVTRRKNAFEPKRKKHEGYFLKPFTRACFWSILSTSQNGPKKEKRHKKKNGVLSRSAFVAVLPKNAKLIHVRLY